MGRAVLGVLVGLVAMYVAITGIEYFGHRLYPPPPGLNPMEPADLSAILAAQPLEAKSIVVLAWMVGAFLGGWFAARVSRTYPRAAAAVVAGVVMAGVAGMIWQLPDHPRWMGILGLALPMPVAMFAATLARPHSAIPNP
jgi:pimeloyl-ACP methyl ester carboxylesterase